MSLSIFAHIASAAGEILIAYTVLSVHSHVMKEKQIDADVFRSMKKEQVLACFGILFILIGLGLHIIPDLLA